MVTGYTGNKDVHSYLIKPRTSNSSFNVVRGMVTFRRRGNSSSLGRLDFKLGLEIETVFVD